MSKADLEVWRYMDDIDVARLEAEQDPLHADWELLAIQYEERGRFEQAAKCRGRAEYYGRMKEQLASEDR